MTKKLVPVTVILLEKSIGSKDCKMKKNRMRVLKQNQNPLSKTNDAKNNVGRR